MLKAIAAEFTRSGLEEATLYQVYHIVADLCGMEKMPTLKMMQVHVYSIPACVEHTCAFYLAIYT